MMSTSIMIVHLLHRSAKTYYWWFILTRLSIMEILFGYLLQVEGAYEYEEANLYYVCLNVFLECINFMNYTTA